MLGLLDGDAIDMVDLLADRVVAPAMRLPGKPKVTARAFFTITQRT